MVDTFFDFLFVLTGLLIAVPLPSIFLLVLFAFYVLCVRSAISSNEAWRSSSKHSDTRHEKSGMVLLISICLVGIASLAIPSLDEIQSTTDMLAYFGFLLIGAAASIASFVALVAKQESSQ